MVPWSMHKTKYVRGVSQGCHLGAFPRKANSGIHVNLDHSNSQQHLNVPQCRENPLLHQEPGPAQLCLDQGGAGGLQIAPRKSHKGRHLSSLVS